MSKRLDVAVMPATPGDGNRTVAVEVKCHLSSLAKNHNNCIQSLVGQAADLHERYPWLVLAYLGVLPVFDSGRATNLARCYSERARMSDRPDLNLYQRFDAAAVILVDNSSEIPRVITTLDQLAETYERAGVTDGLAPSAADFSALDPETFGRRVVSTYLDRHGAW